MKTAILDEVFIFRDVVRNIVLMAPKNREIRANPKTGTAAIRLLTYAQARTDKEI